MESISDKEKGTIIDLSMRELTERERDLADRLVQASQGMENPELTEFFLTQFENYRKQGILTPMEEFKKIVDEMKNLNEPDYTKALVDYTLRIRNEVKGGQSNKELKAP